MRSPLSPPNHQSSEPASQTLLVACAICPLASDALACTMTSPETPASSWEANSALSSVVPLQLASSSSVSLPLSWHKSRRLAACGTNRSRG